VRAFVLFRIKKRKKKCRQSFILKYASNVAQGIYLLLTFQELSLKNAVEWTYKKGMHVIRL
jgi:hypothetical protein